jgi:hypothetical protein
MRKATEKEAKAIWRALDVLYPVHAFSSECSDGNHYGYDDECRRCAAIKHVARRGIKLVPRKEGKGDKV